VGAVLERQRVRIERLDPEQAAGEARLDDGDRPFEPFALRPEAELSRRAVQSAELERQRVDAERLGAAVGEGEAGEAFDGGGVAQRALGDAAGAEGDPLRLGVEGEAGGGATKVGTSSR
jgi:hypothetical protein